MAHICGRLGWEGAHDFAESEDKNGHLEKENITQGGWDIHGTQRWTQGRKLQKRMKKQTFQLIDINSDNADETKLIAGLRSQSLDKAGTKLLSTSSLLAAIGLSHYDQWTKAILRGKDFWNDV